MASKATKDNSFSIDDMPLAGDVTSFRCKCAHEVSLFLVSLNSALSALSDRAFSQELILEHRQRSRLPSRAQLGQNEGSTEGSKAVKLANS